MIERKILEKYLEIPYKHMGRDESGIDCWGLILMFYKDVYRVKLWDIEESYDIDWSFKNKNHFIENYHKEWIISGTPKKFDVVLFKTKGKIVNHGGIYLGEGKFLHASKASIGITRFSENKNYWKKNIENFYRLRILCHD